MSTIDEAEPGTEQDGASRYDQMADGYARWWAPVIRPGAVKVLDVIAPEVEASLRSVAGGAAGGADAPRLLDVGSGTGTLAIAALDRWPQIHVTGIDPAGGMLEVARRNAGDALSADVARRYATEVAPAEELPFAAGSFDLAVSSFVLQLVSSRAAALREIRRVLRPGGTLAWVTWLRSDRPYEPDRIANDVLDQFGFDPPEPDPRCGDVTSPESAALGMRRTGFRQVRAWTGEVVHEWDAAGYLSFLTEFDEASLFADLEPGERHDIEGEILDRLGRLSPDELALRLPTVYAVGHTAG